MITMPFALETTTHTLSRNSAGTDNFSVSRPCIVFVRDVTFGSIGGGWSCRAYTSTHNSDVSAPLFSRPTASGATPITTPFGSIYMPSGGTVSLEYLGSSGANLQARFLVLYLTQTP